MNYFFFIAEEVRQIMAQPGIRSIDEPTPAAPHPADTRKGVEHWKAQGLDLRVCSRWLQRLTWLVSTSKARPQAEQALSREAHRALPARHPERRIVRMMEVARNVNRSVGAMLSACDQGAPRRSAG